MFFRGLHLFAKQSDGGCLLAAWHSPHSLTWRWLISVNRDTSLRLWPIWMPHTNNYGLQWVIRIPFVCLIRFSQQHPMWYRDIYVRMRDERDGLTWG